MERSTWTDERLDDMASRSESQFEQLRAEMRETRGEMRELRGEMRELHSELRGELRGDLLRLGDEVSRELSDLRRALLHLTIGMIGAFAALFAALVAQSL